MYSFLIANLISLRIEPMPKPTTYRRMSLCSYMVWYGAAPTCTGQEVLGRLLAKTEAESTERVILNKDRIGLAEGRMILSDSNVLPSGRNAHACHMN